MNGAFIYGFLDELEKKAGLPSAVRAGGGGRVGELLRRAKERGGRGVGTAISGMRKADPAHFEAFGRAETGVGRAATKGIAAKRTAQRMIGLPTAGKPTQARWDFGMKTSR